MTHRQRLRDQDAERGALGVFLAVLVPGLLLIIGLAVDGGGQVRLDPATAVAAAQDYLDRNGVQGAVTVVDGDTLTVTTTITEPTAFLGLIGIQTMTVEGSGTADLITDQDAGAEP